MAGIKENKEIVVCVAEWISTLDVCLEDGKIDFMDIPKLFGAVAGTTVAIENAGFILTELADLDEAEKNDLNATFAAKFNLKSDAIESLVEKSFSLALQMIVLIKAFRTSKV
jgi:hypothetical protein